MNIIANSCVGGFIYKNELKCAFENPFIWNIIDFKSMYFLAKNFDNINFENYELITDDKWNFSLIIDKFVKVQYVHYKYDPKATKPYVKDINLFSNAIWLEIINKYKERKNRMLAKKEKPIFIFANWYNCKDTSLNYIKLHMLNGLKNNNIICAIDKFYPEFTNIKQISRDAPEDTRNPGLGRKIYEKFLK